MKLFITILLPLFWVSCSVSEGQTKRLGRWVIEDSVVIKGLDFVDMAADTIVDPRGSMKSFYRQLAQLSQNPEAAGFQVSVVHYGDSHIQAGNFSGIVMRRLQNRFGNAGRGMILPHRLTKSNEPLDYKIVTPNIFAKARLLESNPETTVGIGGVGIISSAPEQQFNLIVLKNPGDTVDYRFNRVVVFHDPLAPIITARAQLMSNTDPGELDYITEINLLRRTDSLLLYTYPRDKYNSGAFYGFSLENGRSGVLYHALGINGACYTHWGRRPEIVAQTKALDPELVIISMGSNEASGRNFIEDVFYREIDSFVSKLRRENPKAAILLTTPPEAMRMSKRAANPNQNFEKVSRTILRYGDRKSVV